MIESDNYRDDQLCAYLKSLEDESEQEEFEKTVLADDGEIAEPYHCLKCGEKLETNEIYSYCKECKKMSPYIIPGIDFEKDLLTKYLKKTKLTMQQIESKKRSIDMLSFKAIIYNLKQNGVHESKIAKMLYRDRTDVLHHNKVFSNLLQIGDKEAIKLHQKLNLY